MVFYSSLIVFMFVKVILPVTDVKNSPLKTQSHQHLKQFNGGVKSCHSNGIIPISGSGDRAKINLQNVVCRVELEPGFVDF